MTVLSRRMEILVFPASGFTTAPRLAPEKLMSRYFSAATLFIGLPLAPVRFPCRDQPDGVGFLADPIRTAHSRKRIDDCPPLQVDGAGLGRDRVPCRPRMPQSCRASASHRRGRRPR